MKWFILAAGLIIFYWGEVVGSHNWNSHDWQLWVFGLIAWTVFWGLVWLQVEVDKDKEKR